MASFFFFSSRRRHTRCSRDWSSDVCSSDLGGVEVLSANIEMGQGTLTVFTELAATRLGLEPEDVTIAEADTSRVPNSGPTVASRTTMIVGGLIERAADDLRDRKSVV